MFLNPFALWLLFSIRLELSYANENVKKGRNMVPKFSQPRQPRQLSEIQFLRLSGWGAWHWTLACQKS